MLSVRQSNEDNMADHRLLAAENEDLKRRLVEQARALSECEARYEAVFNSSLTFVSLCTADGVVYPSATWLVTAEV